MMSWIKSLVCMLCLMWMPMALASNIVILALFKDRVVLNQDGKRLVLKTGEVTEDGLKVIDVTSRYATLEINGETERYELGMQINASFSKPKLAIVHIPRDQHGMYRVKGTINKHPVSFLVDTGASALAMNSEQARSLNIPFEEGEAIIVETASGRSKAYKVQLKSVSVGEITLRDVAAVVVHGSAPREVLLGMSFLNRVNIKDDASVMQLQIKY